VTDDELISKKDVLAKTGISYGQLYRWKRKGLIPEAWFQRKSTFTGQETFFPRERILVRIRQILALKDEHALDELAETLTQRLDPDRPAAALRLDRLPWADDGLLSACGVDRSADAPLTLAQAVCLGVAHRLRSAAREEELALVRRMMDPALVRGVSEGDASIAMTLFLWRKRRSAAGVSAEVSGVVVGSEATTFDPEIDVVATVDLRSVLETIQLDLAQEAS
jgi:hypothetical protein